MKLKSLLIILFSIAMLGLADHADAQRRNKYKKRRKTNRKVSRYSGSSRSSGRFEPFLFVGAAVNAGNYFGDLAPVAKAASTDISFTRPGFGVYAGYKFHHSMAVRAGINWIRVSGDDFSADPASESDLPRYARNLSFRNDIKEFQLGLEIYLLPNYGGPNGRNPFNAYLFFGGTVFHHEPMGKVPEADYQTDQTGATAAPNAGEWVKLRELGTEGQNQGLGESYGNISFSVPVTVGAQMRIPGTQLNAGIEFGIRYMFTDFIDDVSGNYVDLSNFTDPLARIMSDRSSEPTSFKGEGRDVTGLLINNNQSHGYYASGYIGGGSNDAIRGNPDDNDMIFVTQLKLTYIIGGVTRQRAKYR